MAPLTKDAVESGISAPETATSQPSSPPTSQGSQAKSAGAHQRSDAVSLEVPVKVHGSRVKETLRGITPQTEPFEEQTSTMIVFPQGGVLRMNATVGAGQMLVLTNLKSKQDAICRVLKVRSFPNMQSYVEVEFTQPQPGYWGVYFPAHGSAGGGSKSAPATAPAPPVAPLELKPKTASEISWAPAASKPAQKPQDQIPQAKEEKTVTPVAPAVSPTPVPAAPAKPASPFVSLGAKEDVQLAADSTRAPRASQVSATIEKEIRAAEPAKPAAAKEVLPRPATTLSLEELRGDEDEISSVLASLNEEENASTEAKATGLPKARVQESSAGKTFGARLDLGVTTGAALAAGSSQNWMLIVACLAVLVLAVGGGVWYFRSKPVSGGQPAQPIASSSSQPARPQSSTPTSALQMPAPPVTQSSSTQVSQAPARQPQVPQQSITVTPGPSPRIAKSAAAPVQSTATIVTQQPQQQQPESAAPNPLATAMDAHPVSSQRAVSQNEAPSLDSGATSAADPGALPGIGSSSVDAPPPPAPDTPLPVGGKVQAPKLISSVLPVYPSVAKQAHVEGDVVIDTQIDKNGNVVHMKAVSGPVVLRQAAVDALRRWKYQPSTLDGQPVAVEMLVTVKFRL